MKLILSAILLFYAPKTFSQFSVEKMKEIQGKIKDMKCFLGDSHDTCYVLANSQKDYYFYTVTLSSGKIMVSEHRMTDIEDDNKINNLKDIVAMVINDHHTAYLFAKHEDSSHTKHNYFLWMKKEKWDNFIFIYKWKMDKDKTFHAMLNRGHHLIVSVNNGLVTFTRDEIVPISIFSNLFEHSTYKFFETNLKRDIYFTILKSGVLFRISEEPKKKIPSVEKLYEIKDKNSAITSTTISHDGHFYFATASSDKKKSLAKIFVWNEERKETVLIHSQWDTEFYFFCTAKDRIYFTSEGLYVYFINRDQSLGGILTHLKHRPISKNKCIEKTFTYANELLFPYDNIIIKIDVSYNEVITKISTPSGQNLSSILMHRDNTLWVLGKELYFYDGKRITIVPNLVLDMDSDIFKRRYDDSLVIGTKSGLYVVKKIN